ncbi:hypothetical protein TcCL_Unassigned04626 [Trypanosoma cruzi]|nr:hypothetical protein TcCL_Unassigned04626 [Trypanosoma cruzi]
MVITEAHWESQWNMNDMWTRGFERLKKTSLLFYFLQEYLMGNKYQCLFDLADILWFAAAGAAVQSRVSAVLFFLHFPCTSAVCFRVYSHVFPSFVVLFLRTCRHTHTMHKILRCPWTIANHFSAGFLLLLSSVDMKKRGTPGGGHVAVPFHFVCSAPRAARLL